jgi:hypothetical protein
VFEVLVELSEGADPEVVRVVVAVPLTVDNEDGRHC